MSKREEVRNFFNNFNALPDEEQQIFIAEHQARMREKREKEEGEFSFTNLTNAELAKHPDFQRFWKSELGKDLEDLTNRQVSKNREAFMSWVEKQNKEE